LALKHQIGLLYQVFMTDDYEAYMKYQHTVEAKVLEENPVAVLIYAPKISHDLTKLQ
jgi:hypothetical protein